LTGIPAIILGALALGDIRRKPGQLKGSGMATAGIILGFLGAGFWLVVLIMSVVDAARSTG
jgi:hypothetical protein